MITLNDDFEASLREMYRPIGEDEILEKALDVLREEGWAQHTLVNAEGRVCMLGALNQAATGCASIQPQEDHRSRVAYELAIMRLNQVLAGLMGGNPAPFERIPFFNDESSTTFEDVTLVFKHAIAAQGEPDAGTP